MKHKAFTIVELLVVIIIISLLIPMIFSIYGGIQKQKTEIDIKQKILFQSYELFEKINVLMQNYTIDYEEYFNRTMVGCNGSQTKQNFKWNVNASGYCATFTAYGNESSFKTNFTGWDLYYLTLKTHHPAGEYDSQKYKKSSDCTSGYCDTTKQAFGQYATLFYDVKNDTDGKGNTHRRLDGDSDDEDLGTGPQAIQDPDNIQELYLISLDGKERLFLRRKLVKQEHLIEGNANPLYETGESLYTIQMLRLKGFDAGQKHNFGIINGNTGLYDGVIDTWACDASQGFFGHGQSVSGAYKDYKLPNTVDDCWVDLYQSTISLLAWNITISPWADPNLAWKQPQSQIHPYITFFTYNGLYLPAWKKVTDSNLMYFFFPLRTTLNVKDTYLD